MAKHLRPGRHSLPWVVNRRKRVCRSIRIDNRMEMIGDACFRTNRFYRVTAKSNFRKGGANLPVCRNAQQGVAHLFGNYFWQSI